MIHGDRHLPGMEPPPKEPNHHQQVIDAFDTLYREAYDGGPTWNPAITNMVKRLLRYHELPVILERMRRFFEDPPEFLTRDQLAMDFKTFYAHFDKLADPKRKKMPPAETWQDKVKRWEREKEEEERNGKE